MKSYASGIDGCRRQTKYDHPNCYNLMIKIYKPLSKLHFFKYKAFKILRLPNVLISVQP